MTLSPLNQKKASQIALTSHLGKAIWVSLFVHGLGLGLVLLYFRTVQAPQKRTVPRTSIPITMIPSAGTSQLVHRGSGPSKKRTQGQQKGPPRLKDLKLGALPFSGKIQPMIPGEGGVGGGGLGSKKDAFSTAEGMSVEKEANLYPFFEGIWNKIDRAVFYPEALAKQRIQGKVSVEFAVRRDGTFTGKFFRTESDDLMLKAYVMAILAHALTDPLSQTRWIEEEEMILVADFTFKVEILGVGAVVDRPQRNQHFKNLFAFQRTSFAEPIVKEKMEEFFRRYLPPIIPLPGGAFYIDFYRAYQLVTHREQLSEVELQNDRNENMKAQWEHLIRKSQPNH